jgi:hypothetical protein
VVATLRSPLPLEGSVTIYAKTTVHCSPDSSMLATFNQSVLSPYKSNDDRLKPEFQS